jgi:hypothetical protein
MSDRQLPTAGRTFRYDTIAQLAGYLIVVGIGTPAVIALQDGAETPIMVALIFVSLGIIAIAAFVFRMVLIRRRFADGDEATGTVVEVRPSVFGSLKTIVYDYTVDGETRRRTYTLSEKLLYSASVGSTVRLIVPRERRDRPFLRDLFE